jgi:hypothetical protein
MQLSNRWGFIFVFFPSNLKYQEIGEFLFPKTAKLVEFTCEESKNLVVLRIEETQI